MSKDNTAMPLLVADDGAKVTGRRSLSNKLRLTYRVFIRDLEVSALVGIYKSEKERRQTISMAFDLVVRDDCSTCDDNIDNVVCYGTVCRKVTAFIVAGEPWGLVELLAEKLANLLFEDERILSARIRLEKPDVMPGKTSVGIEVTRDNPNVEHPFTFGPVPSDL